jgi:hypothetical protein
MTSSIIETKSGGLPLRSAWTDTNGRVVNVFVEMRAQVAT